jgi:hypothetical protein
LQRPQNFGAQQNLRIQIHVSRPHEPEHIGKPAARLFGMDGKATSRSDLKWQEAGSAVIGLSAARGYSRLLIHRQPHSQFRQTAFLMACNP